jgi:uncharacterized protein (DUF58 family)
MIVVDRQRRVEQPSFLVLDPRVDDPDDEAVRERFEHLVSSVATSAVLRLERDESVGLVVGAEIVPPVRGLHRAGALLRPLAEVQPQPADGPGPIAVVGHSTEWWRLETSR